MKTPLLAALGAALVLVSPLALAQKPAPKAATPAPAPTPVAGVTVATPAVVPPNARPAPIEDLRFVGDQPQRQDPYEFERHGVAAAQAGELGRARDLFQKSWDVAELPTAAFNLACVDVREGKKDAAFKQLDRAVGVGLDDERLLMTDTDLAPIRDDPRFATILASARKNRADGDAAVVKEGIFVAPTGAPRAILLLLHDASSDPLTVSGPFTDAARQRGLFVAAPRGPARAGRKRFGWGSTERAFAAVDAAVEEARRRAGALPVIVVGLGRGGALAYTLASRRPAGIVAAGSVGGPFDPNATAAAPGAQNPVAAMKRMRLFLGVQSEAPTTIVSAFRRGRDLLNQAGLQPVYKEWPGTGTGLPADAAKAVKEILDSLTGAG